MGYEHDCLIYHDKSVRYLEGRIGPAETFMVSYRDCCTVIIIVIIIDMGAEDSSIQDYRWTHSHSQLTWSECLQPLGSVLHSSEALGELPYSQA